MKKTFKECFPKILLTFTELIKRGKEGIDWAQNTIGLCYKTGIEEAEQNDDLAFAWFKQAAEKRNAEAQYNLGLCYLNSTGVDQDEKQAFEWFQKAANQGNADAYYNLGLCCLHGKCVTKCLATTYAYFQVASKQSGMSYWDRENLRDEIQKITNMGYVYEFDFGQKLPIIINLKNSETEYQFGIFYQSCNQPTKQSEQEAVNWFQLAADQGHALAQYKLGMCYRNIILNSVVEI